MQELGIKKGIEMLLEQVLPQAKGSVSPLGFTSSSLTAVASSSALVVIVVVVVVIIIAAECLYCVCLVCLVWGYRNWQRLSLQHLNDGSAGQ